MVILKFQLSPQEFLYVYGIQDPDLPAEVAQIFEAI